MVDRRAGRPRSWGSPALLLGEIGLALAIAFPFNRNDLGVVCQTVDQGDRTGRVRKDRVPLLEEQIGGDDDRAVFVATTDDLKQQNELRDRRWVTEWPSRMARSQIISHHSP